MAKGNTVTLCSKSATKRKDDRGPSVAPPSAQNAVPFPTRAALARSTSNHPFRGPSLQFVPHNPRSAATPARFTRIRLRTRDTVGTQLSHVPQQAAGSRRRRGACRLLAGRVVRQVARFRLAFSEVEGQTCRTEPKGQVGTKTLSQTAKPGQSKRRSSN